MTIVLPALAVAFSAFCIWLTVRIVNRKERWAKWTLAVVVGLPVLYVLSIGPVCRWKSRSPRVEPLEVKLVAPMLEAEPEAFGFVSFERRPGLMTVRYPLCVDPIYTPINRIGQNSPQPVYDALRWYLHLWM